MKEELRKRKGGEKRKSERRGNKVGGQWGRGRE